MSYRLLFLIGIALLLFSPRSSLKTKLPRYQDLREKTGKGGVNLPMTPLARAYLLGDKSHLRKKEVSVHRHLNLMHLMTPSGLHLSSLLFVLKPLFKRSLLRSLLLVIMLIMLQKVNYLDSFERMTFFALLRTNPARSFNQSESFLLTFVVYFVMGQYHSNPLSFTLSFLFLGVLIFARHRLQMLFLLIMVQSLISLYFEQGFYLLGALYGFIISLSSLIIFPLLVLETICQQTFISSAWLKLLQLIDTFKGPLTPTPFYLMALFYVFFYLPKTRLVLLCCVAFLPIHQVTPVLKRAYISAPPPHYLKRTVTKKNTIVFRYQDGMVCRSTLRTDQWSTHCHK